MQLWEQFVSKLELGIGQETAARWLKTLKVLRFDACNLYLEAQDSFQALWFDEHIRPKLGQFVNNNQKQIKVHLSLPELVPAAPRKRKSPEQKTKSDETLQLFFDELDPSCSLDEFFVRDENKVAFRILDEVCSRLVDNKVQAMTSFSSQAPHGSPGFLNPLYLYGPAGSGKTHLLMAVCQKLARVGYKAIYARSDLFTEHVVKAIRVGEMAHFRKTYRNAEILLIDDVQVLGRKNATQEEFFHTFNALHTEGKLIILSANAPPHALQFIEPRLISRFEWGLSLPIAPPQKRDIAKILERKALFLNYPISSRTLEFLAESFSTNTKSAVKALEALILRSHLNKHGQKTHLPLNAVKSLLSDLLEAEAKKALTTNRILECVAAHYSIPVDDLIGKSQARESVRPRQLAMYLCRELLQVPYMKIGDLFQRDHSTVMSSIRQVEKQLHTAGSPLLLSCNTIKKELS